MGKITTINHPRYMNNGQPTSLDSARDVKDRPAARDRDRADDDDDSVCLAIDERRLEYRAEGNANIVFAMAESKQVLRVRKSFVDRQIGECLFYFILLYFLCLFVIF
jgi:hypothetical protein